MMTLTVPLRQMRAFPAMLASLGVAPVPTDLTPADSSAFATAITNAVGGDTITLTAGNTYTGPFTLKSGLSSTVTIRSSAHASLPADGQRVASGDRSNMAIIVCGNNNNDRCFSTTGNDADNWHLTALDMRQKSGITNTGSRSGCSAEHYDSGFEAHLWTTSRRDANGFECADLEHTRDRTAVQREPDRRFRDALHAVYGSQEQLRAEVSDGHDKPHRRQHLRLLVGHGPGRHRSRADDSY